MVDTTRAERIRGWMATQELSWLAQQAQKCTTIIEIGSAFGRSTRAIADHLPEGGIVYSVDDRRDYNGYPVGYGESAFIEFLRNMDDQINAGRVVSMRYPSSVAVNRLKDRLEGRPVDMVFIDGDHEYEPVRDDIIAYRPLVRPGGLLCGHDYNTIERHAGVKRAVNELIPAFGVYGSIWWTGV